MKNTQETLQEFVTDLQIMLNSRCDYNDYLETGEATDADYNDYLGTAETVAETLAAEADIEYEYVNGHGDAWDCTLNGQLITIELDLDTRRWNIYN